MQTESAREEQGESRVGAPTGFRRLTPSLLAADRTAAAFERAERQLLDKQRGA
jgi:hypothetical protein